MVSDHLLFVPDDQNQLVDAGLHGGVDGVRDEWSVGDR